jgi:hypothetical protein
LNSADHRRIARRKGRKFNARLPRDNAPSRIHNPALRGGARALTAPDQAASFAAIEFQGRPKMPGLLQGIVLFLVGCVAVYGLIASLKAKTGDDSHAHGGHGGHGHH